MWIPTGDRSVFSEEQLDVLRSNIKEKKETLFINKTYSIDLYETDFDFRKPFILSVDCSTGSQLDSTAFTGIDPVTKKTILVFENNKISAPEIADLINIMVRQFFPNVCIVIERNSIGVAVIDILIKKKKLYRHLYWEMREKIVEKKNLMKETKKIKIKKAEYGHITSITTRPMMIDMLFNIISNTPHEIDIKRIISQISSLERKPNGKIEHSNASHDDVLIAYLIGRFTLAYGKNLHRFIIYVNTKGDLSAEDYRKKILQIAKNCYEPAKYGKTEGALLIEEINKFNNMITPKKNKYNVFLELNNVKR
jgi:hypothetical protein